MYGYRCKSPVFSAKRCLALVGAALACASAPVAGAPESLAMLDRLDSGRWELRMRDGPVERICLQDARALIQLQHRFPNCQRLVIEDSPMAITVQYTCRGHGYGRTHIRRETGRLVQIETQGIVDGLPFDYSFEGRKTGECSA